MDALYFKEIGDSMRDEENSAFDEPKMINFLNITHDDMLNGNGLRVVLWVKNCEHHCAQCHNPESWDNSTEGLLFDAFAEREFYEWLSKPWTKGATFSGGDPLHPLNRDKIGEMTRHIRMFYPGKDIWVYTGYRLEKEGDNFVFSNASGQKFDISWLENIDVLVDGRFEYKTREQDIAQQRNVKWCGSSNQRVIDVQKTLKEKAIVQIY